MRSPRRLLCALSLLGAVVAASGCRRVEFYEREHLGDSLMEMEPDKAETYARQKVLYSREGAAGGIGGGGGGGCGCS